MSWYDTSWKRRLKVTISHDQFAADEFNYAITITSADITSNRFWWGVLATGADIVVTTADGVTKCKRNLISFSQANQTIQLVVRVPALSSTEPTILYIYYSNSAGAEGNDVFDMGTEVISERVASDTDDIRVRYNAGGGVWEAFTSDPTNILGYNNANAQKMGSGMRFLLPSQIKQESYIDSAYLKPTASVANVNVVVNSYIIGELAGTPATFSDIADYQARRGTSCGGADDTQRTTAQVAWDDIVAFVLDVEYTSPDIKTVIQEQVDYNTMTNLVLFWDDHDARGDIVADHRRHWYSYTGSAAKASLLEITYAPGVICSIAYDGAYWDTEVTPVRVEHKIEIRDVNGDLKWVVRDIEGGSLDQQINNAAVASILCPISSQVAQMLEDLDRPNALWVWRDDELLFTGPITLARTKHTSIKTIQVDAIDYFSQLKAEYIETYDALDSVDDHVEAYLAEQVSTMPVLLGTIEPTMDRDITIVQNYIYNALMDLRATVGGYMIVDVDRRLNWYWSLTEESTGQQIRYRKNLTSITKSVDWFNFGNRLWVYGAGTPGVDQIVLSDNAPPWPVGQNYIEDEASIAAYGLTVRKYIDASIQDEVTLLEFAKLKLKETCVPRVTYEVDIVNLADFGISWDEITLGSWVTLIDEEIDVNVDVQVVRVIYDLVKGQNIKVELAAKALDVLDLVPGGYLL